MPKETQLCPPLITPIPILEMHLMPFHVDYSGPTAISTYFLVKPDSTSNGEEESSSGLQRLKKRFKSAFRGRRLKGLAVDVPEGYTGFVLQADNENDSALVNALKKPLVAPPKKTRGTRNHPALAEDEEKSLGQETLETDQSAITETKVLRPTGQFNSITIWNPDTEIDEGYDEYIRTLNGYLHLLAEVCLLANLFPSFPLKQFH